MTGPLWLARKLKSTTQEKNLFYKKHLKSNNQETLQAFSKIQEQVGLALKDSKNLSIRKYYENISNKPLNGKFNGKCYWKILKRFLTCKMIPCIAPLLHEDLFHSLLPQTIV